MEGGMSGTPSTLHQVDSVGLSKVTASTLQTAFQVTDTNPLVLLRSLGKVLADNPKFFGVKHSNDAISVQVSALWEVVMDGLSGIWPPTRTQIAGIPMGDVWPSKALASIVKETSVGSDLIPFHKLSQWLTYSLMEPLSLLGITFEGLKRRRTRYRVLMFTMMLLWVEGLNCGALDKVGEGVRKKLGMSEKELLWLKCWKLAKQFLLGTWKLGREIAAKLRPDTKGPPIEIISDGTVF
ncbi:hypothetical protein BC829DRAFT_381583 [Chytridium lagenaria]|nr:hypothetical protein BC829DRAFT_381583 [Chytridium lagenaria]